MSIQAWFTLVIVILTVHALARDLLAPAATMIVAVVVLLVTGILTPSEAFAGFSNPAPITVAALYVLARAAEKTGALQPLVSRILGTSDKSRVMLARLLFPVSGVSAFLNNTPIVALLAPQVVEWADRRGLSPSRFLMPLSFAAILGGVITVIGTSTNIVVSGLLEANGQPPIGMFELTKLGLPVAVLGVTAVILLAPVVLKDRRPARRELTERIREFVVGMDVVVGGALDGVSVEAGGLRNLQGVFLAELERQGEVVAPVGPATVLKGGDRLVFVGKVDLIVDLQKMPGLASAEREHVEAFSDPRHTFFEVVLGAASALVGRTLKEAGFRNQYQAAVVAIHRAGQRVSAKLGGVELKLGDTLLVLADKGFRDRWRDRSDFLLVARLGGSPPGGSRKAPIVAVVALLIVVVAGAGILPILDASLVGAILLVLLGVLTPGEARGAVDLDVVLLVAASFGLGTAIQKTGLADAIAGLLTGAFSGFGTTGALLGVVLVTIALTEIITNNAAAVLVFPVAMATALRAGTDARPFALAVAVAASASFLTPIGYQTNTMVYGLGGYRFGDYARLGLPLTVIVVAVLAWIVPALWR
ncbi:MAG: SLC13 family permease [Gemmatimonadetes bacterium]|nr:SLC13 family permease [Gemmatimonadota bacterium]